MALQLTGAFKKDALSNLQARLPAVVIGGGLTGVDTATELMAYYPIQVEKTLDRYDALVRDLGEARVRGMMDAEELGILDEFREHGTAVKAERARAEAAGEAPNFIDMIRGWGGVTLAYRKRLQDAPAYRLNHEEVALALQEGISVTENMNPVEAIPDEFGHVTAMAFTRADGSRIELPARTVLVAAGTVAERHLREGTSRIVLARQQAEVLPGLQGVRRRATVNRRVHARAGSRTASSPRTTPTASSSPTTATTIRATTATSSRRWRRPSTATRTSSRCSPTTSRRSMPTQQPQREHGVAVAGREARRSAAGARREGRAPDADDRRSDRARAGGGAAFPSRPVLSPAELRAPQPARARRRSRRVDADGRHRADRRVGRCREGPAVADHARDGRVEPAVRVPQARRARGRDGTDRHADRDSREVGGAAGRRRSRQRRAVLDRQGAQGAGQSRALLRRLQERRRSLQARRHRGRHRPGDLGERHGRRDRAASSAGSSLPRQHRPGDGRVCRRQVRRAAGGAEGCVAHHRDRLRSHDERRPPGAARRAAAATSIRTTSASAASTRRCSA